MVHEVTTSQALPFITESLIFVDWRLPSFASHRGQQDISCQWNLHFPDDFSHHHEDRHQTPIVENGVPEQLVAVPPSTDLIGVRYVHQSLVVGSAQFCVKMGIEDEAATRAITWQSSDNVGALRS